MSCLQYATCFGPKGYPYAFFVLLHTVTPDSRRSALKSFVSIRSRLHYFTVRYRTCVCAAELPVVKILRQVAIQEAEPQEKTVTVFEVG